MNYHCPNCEANLKRRFLVRRFAFRFISIPVGRCPYCHAGFCLQGTESELLFRAAFWAGIVSAAMAPVLFSPNPILWALFVCSIAVLIVSLLVMFGSLLGRTPRLWRRYKRCSKKDKLGGINLMSARLNNPLLRYNHVSKIIKNKIKAEGRLYEQ